MTEQSSELSQKVRELLDVLDRDIEQIERATSRLNELRELVIKRDEQALARVLEKIRTEAQDYQANEQQRSLIRQQLSGLLGCKGDRLTLSVLQSRIAEPAKSAVAGIQQKLKTLVRRLQTEYVSTVTLLSDCARINAILLKIVFDRGQTGPICYDSTGSASRESDAAFMNMRL